MRFACPELLMVRSMVEHSLIVYPSLLPDCPVRVATAVAVLNPFFSRPRILEQYVRVVPYTRTLKICPLHPQPQTLNPEP